MMIDAQATMLALLLQHHEVRTEVMDLLIPEYFTNRERLIFQALFDCGENITPILIRKALDDKAVSPAAYGGESTIQLYFTLNPGEFSPNILRRYVSLLRDQMMERRLMDIEPIINDRDKAIDARVELIQKLLVPNIPIEENTALIECATQLLNPPKDVVYSYFTEVDQAVSHFEGGEVIVLAGASSIGKTVVALNIARNNINNRKPVGVFSLEMKAKLLFGRMACAELNIDGKAMRLAKLSKEQGERISALARQWEQYLILDDRSRTLAEVVSKIRRLARKGVRLFIIDYLQLINPNTFKGKPGNRDLEIGFITRSLKEVANEMDVVIIELSQLSRDHQKRDKTKPKLSDLRESGNIEQDADFVIFVYYPEYYANDGELPENIELQLVIAKGRQTGRANPRVRYNVPMQKVTSIEMPSSPGQTAPPPADVHRPSFANEEMWPSTLLDSDLPF